MEDCVIMTQSSLFIPMKLLRFIGSRDVVWSHIYTDRDNNATPTMRTMYGLKLEKLAWRARRASLLGPGPTHFIQEAHVEPRGALGTIQQEHSVPLRLDNLVHGSGQGDIHHRQPGVVRRNPYQIDANASHRQRHMASGGAAGIGNDIAHIRALGHIAQIGHVRRHLAWGRGSPQRRWSRLCGRR